MCVCCEQLTVHDSAVNTEGGQQGQTGRQGQVYHRVRVMEVRALDIQTEVSRIMQASVGVLIDKGQSQVIWRGSLDRRELHGNTYWTYAHT